MVKTFYGFRMDGKSEFIALQSTRDYSFIATAESLRWRAAHGDGGGSCAIAAKCKI